MPKHLGEKEGCLMEKKNKKANSERPKERINQFIIECMFSKYFEEQKDNKIVVKKEEIAV